jgi:hypothetical protein
MKPENQFIVGVHKYLPASTYHMKNNNEYVSGVPDCWYSDTHDLWIEYKFILLPKRDNTVIVPGLSALQLDWLTRREAQGRKVAVVVGCKEGGVYLRRHQWQELTTGEFKQQLVPRKQLAARIYEEVNTP